MLKKQCFILHTLHGVQVVGGSNPLAPTNKIKDLRWPCRECPKLPLGQCPKLRGIIIHLRTAAATNLARRGRQFLQYPEPEASTRTVTRCVWEVGVEHNAVCHLAAVIARNVCFVERNGFSRESYAFNRGGSTHSKSIFSM